MITVKYNYDFDIDGVKTLKSLKKEIDEMIALGITHVNIEGNVEHLTEEGYVTTSCFSYKQVL